MARSTRNKVLSSKYHDIVAKIVVDVIKGRRKSKKSINLTPKTIFKKFIYIGLSDIDDFSSFITFESIYTISTSVI